MACSANAFVTRMGFEPMVYRLRTCRPRPLDERAFSQGNINTNEEIATFNSFNFSTPYQ